MISFDLSIAEILLIVTLLVMAWQTWLLRKDIKASVIHNLYTKWNDVSKMEIEYPILHKMLMKRDVMEELENLTDEELKERALAYMVFDVFSMLYLEKKSKIFEEGEPYINGVMTNPIMIKCWKDYHVRRAWDGYEFQHYIDKKIIMYEKKLQKLSNQKKG